MKHRDDLTRGVPLPSTWVNAVMEFTGSLMSPFRLELASSTSVRIVAGSGSDQVAIAINGKWRFNTSTVTAAHPGGVSGLFDVYVTGYANDLSAVDPADDTNYAFGLVVRPRSGGTPSPPPASGSSALSRRVGVGYWDGSAIKQLVQLVPTLRSTPVTDVGTSEQLVLQTGGGQGTVNLVTVIAPFAGAQYRVTAGFSAIITRNNDNQGGMTLDLRLNGHTLVQPAYTTRFAHTGPGVGASRAEEAKLSHTMIVTLETEGTHTISSHLMVDGSTGAAVARAGRNIVAELCP